MADRFPLILNTSASQIQEIASGDQLDLTGNNIANAGIVTANALNIGTGVTITSAGAGFYAGIVTASNFVKRDGSAVGGVVSDVQSNTIAGTDAGRDLTSNSNSNSYFGAVAGEKNDTGDNNCGFGRYSAYSIRGGSKNTMLGSESGVACQSGDGNVCIGFQAGYDVTGSNNTLIGHMAAGKSTSSSTDLTSGSNNIFIGHDVKSSTTTISNEIALGNDNITHFRIPGIGVSFSEGGAVFSGIVTATSFSGSGASLTGITVTSDAQSNTVVGTNAGDSFSGTDANSNTLVGKSAGTNITTGDENTALGMGALGANQTGGENVAIGKGALGSFTGSFAIGIGLGAASNAVSGMPGIIIGRNACFTANSSNLSASVVIGMQAASAAASVQNCVVIGDYAKSSGNMGSNNIIIGQGSDCSSTSVSNEITLGNSNITRFRVPGLTFDIQPTAATLNGLNLTGLLREAVTVTAGKLSDNTNIDLGDGNVHYFTTQETTTSTPNLRFSSSVTLNNSMDVGETIAVTIITTAAAAGYSAQLTIDGSAVTENWIGGSAPSDGGSSGVDIYTYNIIKTASATFTVIANQTKTS